ncbi:MAG: alpha-mannosidase [Verrucomicrobia bacterium]|nr:alpha-mannosidase [Verrucomicrobiota bacterium]
MLPDNPFLQLVLPRAHSVLDRIQSLIWVRAGAVACEFGGAFRDAIPFDQAKALSYEPVKLPFHWGQIFDRGWFRVRVPESAGGRPLYLHWRDQGEGTVYIDGTPYYGFDVAHRHCRLPDGVAEFYVEGLCLQSAIWHPEATGLDARGSTLSVAEVCHRDDLAWEVYHDTRVLLDLAIEEAKAASPSEAPKLAGAGYRPVLNSIPVLYRRLLRALDDVFNAFDRGGLAGARTALKSAYALLSGQKETIRAVLTGHAHIDLVWLWPERGSEYKAVHTFSTMTRLMEMYPEFVFGYSQPASYDAVERLSPSLMETVRARIREGRWEPVGATEVESDTQMACGEALSRSFLLGQEGYRRLQGRPSPVLWLPDVFGYSGCLPQIMRQTGVPYFFTTKLTWSNISLFPYSSFVWKGIDGSEVLVHVTQENGYNQVVSAEELRRGAKAYRQSDVHDEFLAPTGYGDGGGGVTEEMCERVRRFQVLAGAPQVGWGRIEDFFERLDESRPRLPVYQGELYLEYHRGVFTTHGNLKAIFRQCERALQTWEAARVAMGGGELDAHYWRRMVMAQFHDYIPGSSIWEVYEEGLPELAAIAEKAVETAAADLGAGPEPALFNPLPLGRTVIIRDEGGEQKAYRLPPLSGASLQTLPEVFVSEYAVAATASSLQSSRVAAGFDARGRVTSLSFNGRPIAIASALGALVEYPDHPSDFDAWDIDRQTLSLGTEVYGTGKPRVSLSELEAGIEFSLALGGRSSGVVRYRVDAFQPVLHIEYDIDWQEEQKLLRVNFPTAYTGRMARFGTPFGSVLRCQQPGESRDEAMFESPASRWAVVADDGEAEGLGVVTESKYGFSCREGVLGVSLVRSPRVTGGEPEPRQKMFPASIRRGGARAPFTDQGRHVIRLALCFHAPDLSREDLAPALADSLYTDALTYRGGAVNSGFLGLSGGESLIPCWAKPAKSGRGWVLRLHETLGRRGRVKILLANGCRALRTDLSETVGDGGSVSEISFSPYEIVSLLIERKQPQLS